LASTQDDTIKQLEKLDYDLTNVDANVVGSSTQIQLQKLEKDLAKAELDYQTKLDADSQTIQNFSTTAQNLYTDVNNLVSDVVTESDKIL
jgi:hypothetical protein